MEKIKLTNGQEFFIVPMGITSAEKRRSFIILSDLQFTEIETAFSDSNITSIQYLSETGEILATYNDCITLKTMARDLEYGTYTIELSIDAMEIKLNNTQKYVDNAICELTIMFASIYTV
jgi:hypothetical protein